mmetsp:Transcript_10559/g.14381  ORF Transcript_10559/g.14381 Transcript_10559/m.14381 type:complete len:485 (+) Transcript_10559:176-1630(+)
MACVRSMFLSVTCLILVALVLGESLGEKVGSPQLIHRKLSSISLERWMLPNLHKSEEATPAVAESTPTVAEATPDVAKATPDVVETTPVVAQTTPVVTKALPAVMAAKTVVTEVTPTVHVATPAATIAAPAVTVVTPAAATPTAESASVTATSSVGTASPPAVVQTPVVASSTVGIASTPADLPPAASQVNVSIPTVADSPFAAKLRAMVPLSCHLEQMKYDKCVGGIKDLPKHADLSALRRCKKQKSDYDTCTRKGTSVDEFLKMPVPPGGVHSVRDLVPKGCDFEQAGVSECFKAEHVEEDKSMQAHKCKPQKKALATCNNEYSKIELLEGPDPEKIVPGGVKNCESKITETNSTCVLERSGCSKYKRVLEWCTLEMSKMRMGGSAPGVSDADTASTTAPTNVLSSVGVAVPAAMPSNTTIPADALLSTNDVVPAVVSSSTPAHVDTMLSTGAAVPANVLSSTPAPSLGGRTTDIKITLNTG